MTIQSLLNIANSNLKVKSELRDERKRKAEELRELKKEIRELETVDNTDEILAALRAAISERSRHEIVALVKSIQITRTKGGCSGNAERAWRDANSELEKAFDYAQSCRLRLLKELADQKITGPRLSFSAPKLEKFSDLFNESVGISEQARILRALKERG